MKFQYVGFGESPPVTINYMSKFEFTLNGPAVDVTDKEVLAKIVGHSCFKCVSEEKTEAPKKMGRPKKVAD